MRLRNLLGLLLAASACKKPGPIVAPPEDPGRPVPAEMPEPVAEPEPEAPYPTASYAEIGFTESAVNVVPGGDIDGDGLQDLLIGLPDSGKVHVIFGKRLAAMHVGAAVPYDRTLESLRPGDRLGAGLAGLGDVDGDGTGDILVGAPAYDAGAGDAGAAWLVLGSTLRDDPSASMSSAWTLYWGAKNDQIGLGLASLGDLDGDGRSEALFPGYRRGYVLTGAQLAAYESFYLPDADTMLVGAPEGRRFDVGAEAAGDTLGNGQGGALVSLPGEDGRTWLFHGQQLGGKVIDLSIAAWGRFLTPGPWQGDLAAAIDLNGDRRPDPVVGWIGERPTIAAVDAGYFAAPAEIDVTTNAFLTIDSDKDWAIHDVTSLGDLDGDGYAEVAVGTRMEGGADTARVYVFRGLDLRSTARAALGSAALVFDYPVDRRSFWWTTEVVSPGDLDGDGRSDLVVVLRGFGWTDAAHTAAPKAVVHLSPWRW